jgi:hypothetical protein
MGETWLRVRRVLDRRFVVVVALLFVLVAMGGWVAYDAHVTPETTTVERTTETGQITGAFTHGATVTAGANGSGFEQGARVENRTVYFAAVMPVLDGGLTLSYDGQAPAQVRVERTVEVRSAASDSGEETTVYWNRTLSQTSRTTTLGSGDRARVPFRFNVSQVGSDAENVSDRLRSPGQVQMLVTVDATVRRQVEDATPRSVSFNLTVLPEGGLYRVESTQQVETFERTETATRQVEPGALRTLGGPGLALFGFVTVAGLVVARYRGVLGPSEGEAAWLDYRDDRTDFDEWITTVRLPDEARDLPVAEAASLADLVDFAIDTDNAVMETPGGRSFHVVHDGFRYTFRAPSVPASAGESESGSLVAAGGEERSNPGGTVDPESED